VRFIMDSSRPSGMVIVNWGNSMSTWMQVQKYIFSPEPSWDIDLWWG
jgi:hypothetical protein